jgi:hypothetical protein
MAVFLKRYSRVEKLLKSARDPFSVRSPTGTTAWYRPVSTRNLLRKIVEVFILVNTGGFGLALMSPPASAMHETDHRFSVEGHVCDHTGRPVSDTQVIVKDARIPEGSTGYTDENGYYKATLHLHNENHGDRIVVTARDEEKQTTAQFDSKDTHTERKAVVNFGTGCEHLGSSSLAWIYYSIGVGVLAVVVVAGTSYLKRQQRLQKRGKGRGSK